MPLQPRWLDQTGTRTPSTRIPRLVDLLKPSRKSSISAASALVSSMPVRRRALVAAVPC
jgi:hypothetical protein